MKRIQISNLSIATDLHEFIEHELLPKSEVSNTQFWTQLEAIARELGPKNQALLDERDLMQSQIDRWHRDNPKHSFKSYKKFLTSINYLEQEVDDFTITVENIDAEIATIAGPQLVVPLDNARYVLSAVNARWGSLYDALYTTDAIPNAEGCSLSKKYNPIRGEQVVHYVRHYLDRNFALDKGTHSWATGYRIDNHHLVITLGDGSQTGLLRPERLIGYTGDINKPDSILLKKNNLHVEICFGENSQIGSRDHAKIFDVRIESAVSTIMDLEDSVASVDTEDKILCYQNWLGVMQGTLSASFEKGGKIVERHMNPDRRYLDPRGGEITIAARSLLLVRNCGAHLLTDAVLLNNQPIPETMLDAMVTAVAGKHDLLKNSAFCHSLKKSIYIVKPKMHGSKEVAFANELFARVEQAIGLTANTLKIGIMDEERRTSVNLKNCIQQAKDRLFFINTGFLDRTGDEIHTSMEAGCMLPKDEMKTALWLKAYEQSNVDLGLHCGLSTKAQIGKGMWAMPDEMAAMIATKIAHPKTAANTAWVPSPTAATLHALHYMLLDVLARQQDMQTRTNASVDDILAIPLMDASRTLSEKEIRTELENNAQGILGYVARWVGQGMGCSKVPDIHNTQLMEDCATLRISSQHIANWHHHGLLTQEMIVSAMQRMAVIVDRQNRDDPNYQSMSPNFDASIPFQAALDLALKGREQANGYTEFILYNHRREMKAKHA